MKVYIDGSQQMMKMEKRRELRSVSVFLVFSVISSCSDGDLNNSGKNTLYTNGKSEMTEMAQVISNVRPPMLVVLIP